MRSPQLPERKGGPCVSTVSIVCNPYWAPAGVGASRSTAVVANGICRDLRAVVPSRHRIHYR